MRVRSPIQTALLVAAVFVAGVVAGVLGLPLVAVVIFVSTVGTGILVTDTSQRRMASARAAAGDTLDHLPLQFTAERFAVGARVQFRFVPATRRVWAPGLLCVGPGEARFVPSKEKHRSRAWAGRVTSSEFPWSGKTVAILRLHGPDGSAQFAVSQPPPNLSEAVAAWIAAPRGSASQ